MPHDWRSSYLTQAKTDYAIFRLLEKAEAPLCHRLHYLQMTTEKLAKGLLTLPGGVRYAKTHDAFLTFVRRAKASTKLQSLCGFSRLRLYAAYIDGLLPLAAEIENLSPEGFDHANPEYPWEAGGTIFVPVEYPFAGLEMEAPQMRKMLEFIESCLQIA